MRLPSLLLVLAAALAVAGCSQTLARSHVAPDATETLDQESPFLKAHLLNGGVYVLSDWSAIPEGGITGRGVLLDPNRAVVADGELVVPLDSVALFETNVVEPSGVNSGLVLMTGITAAVAGMCAVNPKACFGSCPTFYAPGPDGEPLLQAEGFSASIAPALEATDLDMLYRTAPGPDGRIVLRVTNEALETHVIRHMDLLLAPRPPGGRVLPSTDGGFRAVHDLAPPDRCVAPEGDCREALVAFDGTERWSEADSADLAARETLELTFPRPSDGEAGLVLTARQTLMTTYLIYQALAYLGTDAGRWLAALDTGGADDADLAAAMGDLLGRVEVLVEGSDGEWVVAGAVGETGPLASDTRVVPLPPGDGPVRIRLRLTQGLWRLEQAVVGRVGDPVEAERLSPVEVLRDGSPDPAALAALLDPETTLVTLPGDAYDVVYHLPRGVDPELFLESRGYYLEWMRQEWMAEENPVLALRMLMDPATTLRRLAPAYKQGEAQMEEIFWGSRYGRH